MSGFTDVLLPVDFCTFCFCDLWKIEAQKSEWLGATGYLWTWNWNRHCKISIRPLSKGCSLVYFARFCYLTSCIQALACKSSAWKFFLPLQWRCFCHPYAIWKVNFEHYKTLGSCGWCSEHVNIVLENFHFGPMKGKFTLPLSCVLAGLRYFYLRFV